MQETEFIKEIIHIKNMISSCCIRIVKIDLEEAGFTVIKVKAGAAEIEFNPQTHSLKQVKEILKKSGLGLIEDREIKIVEQIKQAVIDLIYHMNNTNSIVQKSEYLVEKLNMSYQQISKLFSKHEPLTLEKYMILIKIERIKDLIDQGELTLSEIAFLMDYSSVQYLSNQFKKITDLSVSEYKKTPASIKRTLDNLY